MRGAFNLAACFASGNKTAQQIALPGTCELDHRQARQAFQSDIIKAVRLDETGLPTAGV